MGLVEFCRGCKGVLQLFVGLRGFIGLPILTPPISHRNKRLNFPAIPIKL